MHCLYCRKLSVCFDNLTRWTLELKVIWCIYLWHISHIIPPFRAISTKTSQAAKTICQTIHPHVQLTETTVLSLIWPMKFDLFRNFTKLSYTRPNNYWDECADFSRLLNSVTSLLRILLSRIFYNIIARSREIAKNHLTNKSISFSQSS